MADDDSRTRDRHVSGGGGGGGGAQVHGKGPIETRSSRENE